MTRRFSVVLWLLASPPVASFVLTPPPPTLGAALHAKARKSSSTSDASNSNQQQPPQDPAKQAALNGVLNQIERLYGRGSIVKLGDAENMRVSCIGSGSLTLDAAIGGGYPKGR
jgi:recombination protein RecA